LFLSDPATTGLYTLSLHDALPISASTSVLTGGPFTTGRVLSADCRNTRRGGGRGAGGRSGSAVGGSGGGASGSATGRGGATGGLDRKSTRLNSSHDQISYAVFCLK